MTVGALLAHAGPGDLPPPFTWAGLFTQWTFDPLVMAVLVVVAAAYGLGVLRLRRRGDRWPVGRTVAFLGLGLGTIAVATQSALGTYDTVLVSVHMVQHMLLAMVGPVFLALGAPVTLALRTLAPAARRVLLVVLHSRVAKVVSFPAVAGVIFVANPWVLYFTPLYEASLRNPWVHDLQHGHFLLVGCLFFWPLLGIDPVPGRVDYPIRLVAIFVTLPFHAFLGITIMGQRALLGGDWYPGLGRDWPPSLVDDQQWAGGILWSSGDLIGLMIFAVLFFQWLRSSRREAVREDRRLDRLEQTVARERAARSVGVRVATIEPAAIQPAAIQPVLPPDEPSERR